MRLRILLIMVIAVMALGLLVTGPAFAQIPPCDSVNLVLAPTHGVASSNVMATGGSLLSNSETEFYWDTTDPSNFLGQVLSDPAGDFIFNFNVPTGATAGAHQVIVSGSFSNESYVECSADFIVDASVQQTAYAATSPITSLPNTGILLLVPAVGLAAGGLGGMILRKRRSSDT
ncbi:MAG: hypothetical protein WC911_07245 [Thermoleophilia bacterium]